jgi:transcriptional regulator with XRE-family HTH domain
MARLAGRTLQRRFGERVMKLRQARGLTQEVLAARSGISQKYLSELERGEKAPSWETLVALAHLGFEMKLAGLLFAIDEGDESVAPAAELDGAFGDRPREARYDLLRAVDLILRAAESK